MKKNRYCPVDGLDHKWSAVVDLSHACIKCGTKSTFIEKLRSIGLHMDDMEDLERLAKELDEP